MNSTAKQKLIPIIGIDFIDTHGHRNTCFQLCTPKSTGQGIEAIACVDLNTSGEVERTAFSKAMKPREYGIIRLARKYQARSIPQQFR